MLNQHSFEVLSLGCRSGVSLPRIQLQPMADLLLISGSPRIASNTQKVTDFYASLLDSHNVEFTRINVVDFPEDAFASRPDGEKHPQMAELVERAVRPSQKMIIISPEYNGSFPGSLKAFIDSSDISAWRGKKVLLTGVATGRAGNLRGLDHLADILMHCGNTVHPNKLPISAVGKLMDADGMLDETTREVCGKQLAAFLEF